ncbi:unnamed protein product [Rangifer tarandus platyrhynchus]|uniref:Uncharacterized protein n=2 Tax=Rangifer tarandus platyrhynchus TaxID=3082113 RepID=A0ABN8Y734_RANTA|nr:unnamed protein product [Rangifer tarandus platyrhynchus]CAI9695438.1 unnamed protein product [Rangifer tarandus platyrhynchus]
MAPPAWTQVVSRNFNESVSSLSPTPRQERRLSWNSDTWLPRDPPPTPACGQARAPDAGPRAARQHPAAEPRGRSRLAPSWSPTRQLHRLSVPECQTSNGDAWGPRATAATVGRKSNHPATWLRASYAKKELAEGKEVRPGTRIGTDAERQLSSFITVDADHEGSRKQKPGQGFPGRAHSPQGWTGWEARLEKFRGRRPGDPPSPENIRRQRTPLPPAICYTLIPQGDHSSPHETKVQLNKYSMRT